jgi:hypothetical protein
VAEWRDDDDVVDFKIVAYSATHSKNRNSVVQSPSA